MLWLVLEQVHAVRGRAGQIMPTAMQFLLESIRHGMKDHRIRRVRGAVAMRNDPAVSPMLFAATNRPAQAKSLVEAADLYEGGAAKRDVCATAQSAKIGAFEPVGCGPV